MNLENTSKELRGRRSFIKSSGLITIGFTLWGCTEGDDKTANISKGSMPVPDQTFVDAWIQVLDNGSVRILTGKMELGQGLTTVMQMVAGEEFNIHPHRVEVVLADTDRTPNEGYTSGSRSVERSAMKVRQAAAAARNHLLELAAQHWQVRPNQLAIENGRILKNDSDQTISFYQLLRGKQLSFKLTENTVLKPKDQYRWVGQFLPHPDLDKIVRGQATYVQDLKFPNMVHARIVRPPAYRAKLIGWDRTIREMMGVLKIVENGSFLGVITSSEFEAVAAWQRLRESAQWEKAQSLPEIRSWSDFMKLNSEDDDDVEPVIPQNAGFAHFAAYSKPYIMHGSIGPSCAVAIFEKGRLHIWSHTQGVYPLRSSISHLVNLAEEQIRIIGVKGSGCYGHNGADDVAAEAALLAMAFPEIPIRLQWMRTNEHQWEPYGSAMCMDLSATLSASGRIKSWRYDLWSDSHSTRPRGHAGNLVSAQYLDNPIQLKSSNRVGGGSRNAEPYYDLPNAIVKEHYVQGPLRVSALRSLGAYANIFAIESFMDELAEKAGEQPLVFRLNHLSDPRAQEVIHRLQELIGEISLEEGEGIGYGFSRYKNTAAYCAVAATIHVDIKAKQVEPLKMWAVIDAGEVISPDGLKNQTEGGMIQAVSWTLKEEVAFDQHEILSRDWESYPIIRFNAIPETEVHIIDRPDESPLGAGEAAQGPAAAALANALYNASGKRFRDLPIEKHWFG